MKEIEVLFQIPDGQQVQIPMEAKHISTNHFEDYYLYHKDYPQFQPSPSHTYKEILRLRKKEQGTLVTHKVNHFDAQGDWTYSDETEYMSDSFEHTKNLFMKIGFQTLFVIDNTKRKYEYEGYHIFVEEVNDLGHFVEIELQKSDDITEENIEMEKQKIVKLAELLFPMCAVCVLGKPELYTKKNYSSLVNLF